MTAVPATFGKYFLTGKLATGGMAEIYLAKLIGPGGFEKHLVIKQIHPQFSRDAQFLEMFVAEAKTLVSLSHGNIVPIYELGVVDDTYFIAMEYIDGPTQERFFRSLRRSEETVSPAVATYISAEILKGLDYAHRKDDGVIHRDLSGRNVMLSREGGVKLVDFGLAVHTEGHQLGKGAGGRPAGSFPYMSPEQVRGEKLDPRSDLFSAGVLLWEMLTGESLFAKPDADETLKAVCEANIRRPSALNPKIPDALDTICMKALARDREERFPSAAKFLRPLTRFLYSSDEVVGAAELSKLITRLCPPSSPILARASLPASSDTDATSPEEEENDTEQEGDDEPGKHLGGTVVMSGRTEGKRKRADTVTTFATNAVWREELQTARVEPGSEAARAVDSPAGEMTVSQAGIAAGGGARGWALLAVALALVAGFSVAMWWRSSQLEVNPSGGNDADVDSDAGTAITNSNSGADGAPGLAAVADASTLMALDAGASKPDAATKIVRRKRDAGPRKVVGSATLVVGASPWADVTIDGRPVGRAPGSFKVGAGAHKVVATFKGQRKSWSVNLADKQKRSLFIDFSKPL